MITSTTVQLRKLSASPYNIPIILSIMLATVLAILYTLRNQCQQSNLGKKLLFPPMNFSAAEVSRRGLRFLGYYPSIWETEFLSKIDGHSLLSENVCETEMVTSRIQTWLNTTMHTTDTGELQLDTDVFSEYKYIDTKSGKELSLYIEPLVRHFRNPLTPHQCAISGVNIGLGHGQALKNPGIQDREYLLLLDISNANASLASSFTGRKYLFDLGTATYTTGLQWFVEHYRRSGVQFDEIWAWEVGEHQPKQYWSEVPAEIKPAMHFFNIPASDDADSPESPVNILRNVYRPGDFVVFKLDIDNSPLELSIFHQILNDSSLVESITEMMFEMHYDHPDMQPYFGRPSMKWHQVLQQFSLARNAGLRLHYWP